MTTDIARMDGNAVAVLGGASEALARLGDWVTAAQQAHSLVTPLVDTAFVPDAYKPKIDPRATDMQRNEARQVAIANATAAVLQGITLGLDPMTALQQIYIVHGRPGMYTKLMVALVQAHGHEVWDEDLSDSRAVVCGRRRGSEHTVRVVVTMDQARRAGWTSNQAYAKTPQDMLWSRAAARVCDRIGSDVLKGIASVEEIRDSYSTADATGNGTRTVSPRRRAAPALAAQPAQRVDEPPLDDEPATPAPAATPAPEAESPPEGDVTGPQKKKLLATFGHIGVHDRNQRLALSSAIVNRTLLSANDLTKDEASALIDTLERAAGTDDPRRYLDQLLGAVDGEVVDDRDQQPAGAAGMTTPDGEAWLENQQPPAGEPS